MSDNPKDYPVLGRIIYRIVHQKDRMLFRILIISCIIVFLLEWTYEKHPYFEVEELTGFYAFYGFIMFSALIFVATILRIIVKVRENFYGSKSIDIEEYPENQIQKVSHEP